MSDPAVAKDPPKGLGGWLILVGFGLTVGLIFRAFQVLQSVHLLTNGDVRFMSDPRSAAYVPGYVAILRFQLIAHIAFLAFNILLAILFVRESRRLPRSLVVFLCAHLIYMLADHFMLAHAVAGSSRQLQQNARHVFKDNQLRVFVSVVATGIWIAYMVRSKRVKATFVR